MAPSKRQTERQTASETDKELRCMHFLANTAFLLIGLLVHCTPHSPTHTQIIIHPTPTHSPPYRPPNSIPHTRKPLTPPPLTLYHPNTDKHTSPSHPIPSNTTKPHPDSKPRYPALSFQLCHTWLCCGRASTQSSVDLSTGSAPSLMFAIFLECL